MSYPLNLQPLVIEDEEGPKETYEGIFETLAAEHGDLPFSPAPPHFAFSYEEAAAFLDSSKIFHVVILDLRLPEKPKLPPPMDGIELGLNLLARCVNRDRYPIPALLVISAHIGSAEQTRMQETLRQGFYYGRDFVKGDYTLLQDEIRLACKEAIRYCSVGIHLRDAGDEQFPTVTPREEDLLRRSVLQQTGGIGLDLEWWSAKRSLEGLNGGSTGAHPWTKVLMGRYLLDGGRGASRPKFFKLLPGSHAKFAIASARHVEHKLTHIKLTTVSARSTALIVTEKVGAQDERPRSLEEFFKLAGPEQASDIARQITEQVQRLGDLLPDSRPLREILWPAHDSGLLKEQWSRLRGTEMQQQLGSEVDPIALYSELARCEDKLRLKERSLVHGDLHISNVALDFDANRAEAYIFDPGGVARDVAGRDLAVLEVSVILHQPIEPETLSQICSNLYNASDPLGRESPESLVDPVAKNIVKFIRTLREAARAWNDPDVYALMVFDFVLIQVGGLAFEYSGNKIRDHRSAVYLLTVVAVWYQSLRRLSREQGLQG